MSGWVVGVYYLQAAQLVHKDVGTCVAKHRMFPIKTWPGRQCLDTSCEVWGWQAGWVDWLLCQGCIATPAVCHWLFATQVHILKYTYQLPTRSYQHSPLL